MTDQVIYQVALAVPFRRLYDYLPPPEINTTLQRGCRVKVPFGRQELIGVIMKICQHSDIPPEKLKPILVVCEEEPIFSEELCHLFEITARYYHHPIGEVVFTGAPLALRQGKAYEAIPEECAPPISPLTEVKLNQAQHVALKAILDKEHQFAPFLLDGITGSGKTEVYLQVAAQMLNQKRQVLILVPEISLTPQTLQRFQERFGDAVICYHSKLTPKARWQAWCKVKSQQASIVVGTRSAIFLPFLALGFIVVDEEHDLSFKQQEGFRYSARDVAVLRAKQLNCPIVLGSATPAFESLFNVKTNKYQGLVLPERATQSNLPEITQLDVRHKKLKGGLCAALLHNIEEELARGGQVLLFINQRGFAPTFMCYACGWMGQCQHCDSRLTYHQKTNRLICHHCLHQQSAPSHCPSCNTSELHPVGQGTERLENVLQERFPEVSLARIDSDMTRKKGSLEQLLTVAENKEAQILIGTQILAKGHHFPHLTLVAIVDADGGLFSTDFRAVERMAQLIIQVAGRAGRVHQAGKVIIQTLHPDHPLLQQILKQDYRELAQILLQERKQCQLPPFTHLALIRAQGPELGSVERLLKEVQRAVQKTADPALTILGPVPAPMLKRQGNFRFQLLMQAVQRQPLHQALSHAAVILENSKFTKKIRWSLDVDPLEMF
ncbi:MAG: primosomal protein N' [Candidatus Berkiellales bacterium]